MDYDNIIHLDLRSDLENGNHTKGTYFSACGYWERLPLHLAEASGDTNLLGASGFIIQAIGPDHIVTHTYFYDSDSEYWNDHKITRGI